MPAMRGAITTVAAMRREIGAARSLGAIATAGAFDGASCHADAAAASIDAFATGEITGGRYALYDFGDDVLLVEIVDRVAKRTFAFALRIDAAIALDRVAGILGDAGLSTLLRLPDKSGIWAIELGRCTAGFVTRDADGTWRAMPVRGEILRAS